MTFCGTFNEDGISLIIELTIHTIATCTWRMICLRCSEWDETTFDAKLMKFQTRIKFCSRNRWYRCIPDRNIPMNCCYQSVWSIDSWHALSIISGRQLRSDVKINCSRDAHLITAICIIFYSYLFPRTDSSPFAVSIMFSILQRSRRK